MNHVILVHSYTASLMRVRILTGDGLQIGRIVILFVHRAET